MSAEDKPSAERRDLSNVEWLRGAGGDEQPDSGRIELAFLDDGTTLMRDGDQPGGPVLEFTPAEWQAFVEGVKEGEFDLSDTHPGLWRDEERADDDPA